jgi:hypothetical protein
MSHPPLTSCESEGDRGPHAPRLPNSFAMGGMMHRTGFEDDEKYPLFGLSLEYDELPIETGLLYAGRRVR